jgi:hypothetical protein
MKAFSPQGKETFSMSGEATLSQALPREQAESISAMFSQLPFLGAILASCEWIPHTPRSDDERKLT